MRALLGSMQVRLSLLMAGFALLLCAAVLGVTVFETRHELNELLDAHLAQTAALLLAQEQSEFDDLHAAEAPTLHHYAAPIAFQVFQRGHLHMRSVNAPESPMVHRDAIAAQPAAGFHDVTIHSHVWRVFVAQSEDGGLTVQVGEEDRSRAAILEAVLLGTLSPMLMGLPLTLLAVWWVVARGLSPLRRLTVHLTTRPADEFSLIPSRALPTDLQPMVTALNGLFERISNLLSSERRFTADAAHELRTPIAAIRAQAQVAALETGDPARSEALSATIEGCDRAARIVDQLLMLARLDAQATVTLSPLDLGSLCREVLADAVPWAKQRGQEVALQGARSDLRVNGDETLLKVLLRNLVDNALRYSDPGGSVVLTLTSDRSGGAILEVADDGPGLDDDALRRLGERFFRAGAAQGGGSGLGWSIATRVARLHRGELHARRGPARGLVVTLRLPVAQ